MSFYGFIWVSRNWAVDRIRFKHRLDQLKRWRSKSILPLSLSQSHQPKPVLKPQRQGQEHFNKETSETSLPPAPFWLLIFPEGTNLSPNTRAKSQSWAVKSGQEDLKHLLLPRHTGLLFCLRELQGSVDWLYDCTMGYGGVSYVSPFQFFFNFFLKNHLFTSSPLLLDEKLSLLLSYLP